MTQQGEVITPAHINTAIEKKHDLIKFRVTVFLPEREVKVFLFNDSLTSEPQSGTQKVALMSLMLIRVSLWFKGQILKKKNKQTNKGQRQDKYSE